MLSQEKLHWEITPVDTVNRKLENWNPTITFYRTVDGQEDIRSRPFNKREIMTEIHIKEDRGDIDLAPWQEALHKLTTILH